MCGRFPLRKIDQVRGLFDALALPGFEEFTERPRFNIAPSQHVPIIRMENDQRVVALARWGLIPSWTKGKPKMQPINARAETVATLSMFRGAFKARRCLVPADGFYEWRKIDAKTKEPTFIHFPDDRVFAFAGLWERWTPVPGVEPVDTMTIITTVPNAEMKPIHDRMPVILDPSEYGRWLDVKTPPDELDQFLDPFPDDYLETYPVSTIVNSPKNDGPSCVEPVAG